MQDAFHAALKRAIDEIIKQRSTWLCSGAAASFDDYRKQAGYIEAMNDVLEICLDIHSKLYSDNPLKGAA